MSGAGQDADPSPEVRAKTELPLRTQDSSIHFDAEEDAIAAAKTDQQMKDESQIQEKKPAEAAVEIEGKQAFRGSDVISKDFMSRTRQVTTFTHPDGQKHSRQRVLDSFAAVMVRVVGFKELYEAWENQCRSVVENFKESGEGEASQLQQTDWLDEVPKVLCLQLNRLDYKDAEPFKHRHKVAIEKTLYVDRFMMQNSERSQQISTHVAKLREQIRTLELSI